MKKVKDFFDKKQSEFKFKKAGAVHKLSDSTVGPSTSSRNLTPAASNAPGALNVRRNGPDANVASAALARFEDKNINNATSKVASKATLHDIMAEEKRKINEEMRIKEELEVFSLNDE